MPNYQNGKIYAIRSHQTTDIYIGSTTQSLSVRFGEHKRKYKLWINSKVNYITSYEIMKYDDCYIEEIEKCPCNDKNELNKREGQLIREMECINKRIEGRTMKEYYQDNKESRLKYAEEYRKNNKNKINEGMKRYYQENKTRKLKKDKEYYQANKEIIRQKRNKKFTCECGGRYTDSNRSCHLRTKMHKKYLDNI